MRRHLAASLRTLSSPPTPASPPAIEETSLLGLQLRLAAAESAEEHIAEKSKLFVVRRETALPSPLVAVEAGNPFAGQTPTHTFGPFHGAQAQDVWFDEFLIGSTLQITWAGRSGIGLVVPAVFLPTSSPTDLEYGACTIWVDAGLFTGDAPPSTFAGWKVLQASVRFSAEGTLDGNTNIFTLPSNAILQLSFKSDDTEVPAPPPGPGADAGATQIQRPANADLTFNTGGLISLRADAASVTAFGLTVAMSPAAAPPHYDANLKRLLIPYTPAEVTLAGLDSRSTLCKLAGNGKIEAAEWSPATLTATPDQLGIAGSGGALVLTVSGTFTADTPSIDGGPVRLGRSYILADIGAVEWIAPAAVSFTARSSLSLWQGSTLGFTFDKPFPFDFQSSRFARETVEYNATLDAVLDQPKQANGSAVTVHFSATEVVITQDAASLRALVFVTEPFRLERIALALSNGLFTATPAQQLLIRARLMSPRQAASGTLFLVFGVYQLLPMLPDPYAANFDTSFQADAPRGLLLFQADWLGAIPKWTIALQTQMSADGSPVIVPAPSDTALSQPGAELLRDAFYLFVHPAGIRQDLDVPQSLRLLDLSTNSDQLGVNLSFSRPTLQNSPGPVQIDGVDLVSLGGNVELLMLPQVQWEPVQVIPNPNVIPSPPGHLFSPDDGGPTLIAARTVRLTQIAPLPVAAAAVDAYNLDSQPTGAFFTLPFGIRALALLNPQVPFDGVPPAMKLIQQSFDNSFTAATQIRLVASPAQPQHIVFPVLFPARGPLLPGAATQLVQAHDLGGGGPPISVLTPLDAAFNNTFGTSSNVRQIPIEQIDLSGYGASLFSNWFNPTDDSGITNVKFEVLNGRTRYEVLRMRSKLIPCDAVVIRTITVERRANGGVFRWDSGWVAASDGLFEWNNSDAAFHTGAVRSFRNIREIRDSQGTINLTGAAVNAVHFDADIAVDHVVRGASSGNLVPALNQLGFVQQIAFNAADPLDVKPLTSAQLHELYARFDPVGGNLDCVVDIGGSGQEMRVTGVFSSAAAGGGSDFVLACYGSLSVPSNDQWTMIRSGPGRDDIAAVDAHRGVPLVRRGGNIKVPASGPYRIVEPEDLLNESPNVSYGLQLTTRTNCLLFLNPEIQEGVSAVTGNNPPILADPYALVGSGGPFPPLRRCLHLTSLQGYTLDVLRQGYQLSIPPNPIQIDIPDIPDLKRFLVKSGAFDLRVDYADVAVQIASDAGLPWSINLPEVPSVLNIHTPDFGKDILTIVSDLYSPDATGLTPPKIEYGEALSAASQIITALAEFAPADAPPLQIDLSPPRFDDPSLHLNIAARFPIANEDGSSLDTGIGKFRGELGMGTEIQVGLSGFGGRIYFNLLGELQQALLPKLLYVGGSLFLEISIDESGTPELRLITSAVASIGGDLIPGLISVEGSASYGYLLDTAGNPFTPGVALGMEARARLVSGLVGVRFRADVTVGVTSVGPVQIFLPRPLLISGTFTAHLSVVAVWVFEKSFDKTLRFHQEIPAVVAGVLAVYTGMVPLPV
jgi:hypothetical protein